MKVAPLFDLFPREVAVLIERFLPKPMRQKSPPKNLDRELTRLQKQSPKVKPSMWLYGLEDFMLE
jgi:hypothetical protein